jgi:hypothetical protein
VSHENEAIVGVVVDTRHEQSWTVLAETIPAWNYTSVTFSARGPFGLWPSV